MSAPPEPEPPSGGRLQTMLQTAVQSVQWTYSLFWQLCPQKGMLVWSDGYYNGAIKTRKTVQPMEVSTEEASLQRSQQLRELYDSLSIGETNQPARRPSAALSPEDLTESEWFYLMCVSFSYSPGVGLPGKAYSRRQHVWLTGVNEVDSKVFCRAILAKSASIQTVVCIPLLDGVVEFGTVDKVKEDLGFVQHVKTFFVDHNRGPPKPALSGHSTSNPATSSDATRFHYSPPALAEFSRPRALANNKEEEDDDDDDDEEDDDQDDAEVESDSEAETAEADVISQKGLASEPAATEPSELMQLDMSEDIRLGSPDDGSNNLDSDFHMLPMARTRSLGELQESCRVGSGRHWPGVPDPSTTSLPLPQLGHNNAMDPILQELSAEEDTHYSETVSTILQIQTSLWSESSSPCHVSYSHQSPFATWTPHSLLPHAPPVASSSQTLLKQILFTVPLLHAKPRAAGSGAGAADAASRLRRGGDELSANHVLAERRRREKLNERFVVLRSLVPFVTKMDKASILGDTIEYLKQLRSRIHDLEGARAESVPPPEKRKVRVVEGLGGGPAARSSAAETTVQVSIIESEGLLELQCPFREGLLLEIMQMLREMRIEVTTVNSSLTNGCFIAELRAKVKENANGKKASIVEVKRAINQIIPHRD